MEVVILAGGLGTRLAEETEYRPKPMVEIGGMPIIWHIMKIYSAHGFNDFIVCPGYKGYVIKEYFANYVLHMSDVTFDLGKNSVEIHARKNEPWRVTLVDTGAATNTGGRVKRILPYVAGEDAFCLTYVPLWAKGDSAGQIMVAPASAMPWAFACLRARRSSTFMTFASWRVPARDLAPNWRARL